MERETTTFVADGHEYKLKTYITAKEKNLIQQKAFIGAKVEMVNDTPKVSDFNPNIQWEVKIELIRQIVLEMDGTTENIVERCENLPTDEFDTLTAELDAIASKKKS